MTHLERQPRERRGHHEDLDPRHFYAAYVFDQAHERQDDIATLIERAQHLGYPVRYWWLSEAMALQGYPDRLIVCVHHPSSDSDAGMDLYETLKEHQVTWDELEAAAVGEYCQIVWDEAGGHPSTLSDGSVFQLKGSHDLIDLPLYILWQIEGLIVTQVLQDDKEDHVTPRNLTVIGVRDQLVLSFVDQDIS